MRYDQMCKHRNQRTMTLEHGQLLLDSGFSKLGSRRSSFDSSVHTITKGQTELYYQLETAALDALYFGKHATATTRQMVDPSTSASHRTAAECIASIRSNIKPELTRLTILKQMQDMIDKLSSSPKTSCLPLKWELPDGLQVTPSWGQSSQHIPRTTYFDWEFLSRRGSTRMVLVKPRDSVSPRPYDTSALGLTTYAQLKTRSTTASGK